MSGHLSQTQKNRWIAIVLCSSLILVLLVGVCAGMAGGKTRVAYAGGGGTATSTLTPTPTRTPITGSLKSQLAWGGLGGGPEFVRCEPEMLKNRRLPALVELGRVDDNLWPGNLPNLGALCIFGVPYKEGFTVDLYRPDGTSVDHVAYSPNGTIDIASKTIWKMQPGGAVRNYPLQYAADINGVPAIDLDLWLPLGLTEGRWHVTVSAPGGGISADFNIPPYPQMPAVRLNQPPVIRFPNARPLDNPKEQYDYYLHLENAYKTGDSLRLYGANFTPGSSPLIGLYLGRLRSEPDGSFKSDLVAQINARADGRGEWNITYTIPPTNPPGSYSLIVVLNPGTDWGNFAGDIIEFEMNSWQPCSNTYPSLLRAGMHAKVIEGQKSNRLRSQPTNGSNNVIGSIPAGQPFDILDGPRCSNGWVWWNVRAPDGKQGWTAEGDQNQRWLTPVN